MMCDLQFVAIFPHDFYAQRKIATLKAANHQLKTAHSSLLTAHSFRSPFISEAILSAL